MAGEETRVCANDPSHIETQSILAHGHDWDEGEVTLKPTNTSVGSKKYTCKICGDTYDVELPMITDDGLSVVAFITLMNGNSNQLTITVTERGIDDSGEPTETDYTGIFTIANNPIGDNTYSVGRFSVLVIISGNKITEISIVS